MRVGIFSDVHANLEALMAVLGALEASGVEKMICLGDTVGYGGSPNECCDIVRRVVSFAVLGNHDAAVAGRMDYSYYYDAAREALDMHSASLSADNMAWLRSLPYERREGGVYFCHASPARLEEFEYVFSLEQAAECLAKWNELGDVTFIGHSHFFKAFALSRDAVIDVGRPEFLAEPGPRYIISVGSVGQPRDEDPRAGYAIFDTESRLFALHRVTYDVVGAAQKILAAGIEPNFARRLLRGV